MAWRPLELINPAAYVYLVNIMTNEKNWQQIKNRFGMFQNNKNIKCCSMPIVKNNLSSISSTIKAWSKKFEKESIRLSLDYNCLLITDISNCYGSIYTHSIAWAIHPEGKEGAKRDRGKVKLLCNAIDCIIQNISNGQTNGIPQGSILMDFIAEIVLGYADSVLSGKLENDEYFKNRSYRILRYRDDYRIFTENRTDAEKISQYLSGVLMGLNLRLNENKTRITENIITDSQKSDKLYWRNISESDDLYTRILQIHTLAEKYPQSGSVDKALTQFRDDMEEDSNKSNLKYIASVIVDIAFRNPRTYPYAISILGKIESMLPKEESKDLFDKIIKKFSSVPNSEYLHLWLQRLSKIGSIKAFKSNSPLCKHVEKAIGNGPGGYAADVWDCSVCGDEVRNIFRSTPIVDIMEFKSMPDYPMSDEIRIFQRY